MVDFFFFFLVGYIKLCMLYLYEDLENRAKEAFVLFFSQWLSFFAILCSLGCM